MEITKESQLLEIDAGLKRLGITQHKLEVTANILVGTIKDLRRRGKRPLDADKWEKIKAVLYPADKKKDEPAINDSIMLQCYSSILKVASEDGIELTEEEKLKYSVKLYNHVIKHRASGATPDISTADLILQRVQ